MAITVARIHIEVPDDLHRRAKAAAAMQGVTLKDFVIHALENAIEGDTGQARKRSEDPDG